MSKARMKDASIKDSMIIQNLASFFGGATWTSCAVVVMGATGVLPPSEEDTGVKATHSWIFSALPDIVLDIDSIANLKAESENTEWEVRQIPTKTL